MLWPSSSVWLYCRLGMTFAVLFAATTYTSVLRVSTGTREAFSGYGCKVLPGKHPDFSRVPPKLSLNLTWPKRKACRGERRAFHGFASLIGCFWEGPHNLRVSGCTGWLTCKSNTMQPCECVDSSLLLNGQILHTGQQPHQKELENPVRKMSHSLLTGDFRATCSLTTKPLYWDYKTTVKGAEGVVKQGCSLIVGLC